MPRNWIRDLPAALPNDFESQLPDRAAKKHLLANAAAAMAGDGSKTPQVSYIKWLGELSDKHNLVMIL